MLVFPDARLSDLPELGRVVGDEGELDDLRLRAARPRPARRPSPRSSRCTPSSRAAPTGRALRPPNPCPRTSSLSRLVSLLIHFKNVLTSRVASPLPGRCPRDLPQSWRRVFPQCAPVAGVYPPRPWRPNHSLVFTIGMDLEDKGCPLECIVSVHIFGVNSDRRVLCAGRHGLRLIEELSGHGNAWSPGVIKGVAPAEGAQGLRLSTSSMS